ncbi:MAG: chemotaxis response regulator protein-glutamate methylesterase [Alphaproteobacteria bacterium]|nr:chemotaxis response regulator protein-glutamate methylesterase [Alphaproteobacteria bacterium]
MSVSDKYMKTRHQKVRVMIVDDSVVVRGLFSKWLSGLADIEVIAVHRNGKLAVDNIASDKPDVVLLDIEMPVMDGITALPLLLKNYPDTKIVISSTLTTRNAEISLKAMALGAVDYVAKPQGAGGLSGSPEFKAELIQKIRVFGGVVDPVHAGGAGKANFKASSAARSVIGSAGVSRARITSPTSPALNRGVASAPGRDDRVMRAAKVAPSIVGRARPSGVAAKMHPISTSLPKAIVVGSSTGGPPALIELTKSIAKDVDHIPIFITQHMPASFTKILAQHIAKATGRACKEAENGEAVKNGTIYIAPGGQHMSLTGTGFSVKIKLDDGPQINFCKPSVDPLFMTAATIYKKSLLSVILTGMGNDGTPGAGQVINQGGTVLVQDEKTSVVWGMPGSAVHAGVVSEVLPLTKIGPKVSNIVRGKM